MQSSDSASVAPIPLCPPANTPPSSPRHSPTSQIVTLDAQNARTPPPSPTLLHLNETVTVELLQKTFIEAIKAVQKSVDPAECSNPLTGPSETDKTEEPRKRASKLEVKSVLELWDEKTYKYMIQKSPPTEDISELDQYVFVERIRIDKETHDRAYYLDIKSEGLRDILREVFRNVKSANLREDKPTIRRDTLYLFLSELETYRRQAGNGASDVPTQLKHLDLLIDYVQKAYKTTTERLVPLLKHSEITYDLVWALFKPNDLLYTTCFATKKDRAVVFDVGEERMNEFKVKYYSLTCQYRDFNGTIFGDTMMEVQVPKFSGVRRIETLAAFPFGYHPRRCAVEAELVECGRQFIALMGSHHCYYKGDGFLMTKDGPYKVTIDSRIMVDAAFFRKMNPNYSRPKIDATGSLRPDPPREAYDMFGRTSITVISPHDRVNATDAQPSAMTRDELMTCCPTVLAFSFKDKLWLECAVAGITSIKWSSAPFDSLALPPEQKELVKALAEARMATGSGYGFDDVVEGKGQGLIALLHGPPGVGKTLTAEAVAEQLRRPLYSISAGELGIQADVLEERLSRIFQLAHHWNAVLLLDEADVYLEQRVRQDIARNGLVAVFIRSLEYCKGVFFLTSNRLNEFDQAVCSRVHLFMKYNNLEEWARRDVWKTFLNRANTIGGPASVSTAELDRLVAFASNGRQIKNYVRLAHVLATVGKVPLGFSHIKTAIRANGSSIPDLEVKDKSASNDHSLYEDH